MKILAIETSCDETAIAILKALNQRGPNFEILSNIIASQVRIHRKYGGVYPSLARREHEKNLIPVLERALEQSKMLRKIRNPKSEIRNKSQILNSKFQTLKEILKKDKKLLKNLKNFLLKYKMPRIDLIGVTIGPGLEPCLWTGVNFAKALAFWWNLPIIPVNHIEAHIYANWLDIHNHTELHENLFPAICSVVSGGHTQLILLKDFGKYKIIGETRDDASGECFDKTARILGLPYPGGPAIAAEAKKHQNIEISKYRIKLPRPLINSKDYDFSFSGLKTAVLYDFKNRSLKVRKSKKYIQEMAHEIQQAIIDVLVKKTIKAAKDFRAKTAILGGGVAANEELRKQLSYQLSVIGDQLNLLVPPKIFCTDNAAMIGVTAFFHKSETRSWQEIKAEANLRISF